MLKRLGQIAGLASLLLFAITTTAAHAGKNEAPVVTLTSPADGEIYEPPATIYMAANAIDPDGTVAYVEFYYKNTLLGTDTTAPYEFTWTNVPIGNYTLQATAYDNQGKKGTSNTISVRVNDLPSVSIATPADGARFLTTAPIVFTANASDSDGRVKTVEYYRGTTLLGTARKSPWDLEWSPTISGTHTITAKAIDDNGGATVSAPISVSVNYLPTASITAPADGQVYNYPPQDVPLAASASDSDGTVAKVEFYQGETKIGEDTTAPFAITWSNVPVGTYSVTAVATDNEGESQISAPVTVILNDTPTATMAAPAHNTVYDPLATIDLEADANDNDGTIVRVDFYQNGSFLASDSQQPFRYSWTNVPGGEYQVTAVAVDDRGAESTSAPITVWVNRGPATTVTGPVESQGVVPYAPFTFTADSNDREPGGSVAKVEFYLDGTLLGENTTAPYEFAWTAGAPGSHQLTAVGTDDRGLTESSAVRNFYVTQPPVCSITAPAINAAYEPLASFTVTADASDPDESVAKVVFYLDGVLLSEDTTAPYEASITDLDIGNYTLTAIAQDTIGARTTSSPVTVYVTHRPVVTSATATPIQGAAPLTVDFAATATDQDDDDATLTYRWTFGDGGIATGQTANYIYTTPGKYIATAYASDGKLEGSAQTVEIDVQAPVALVTRDQDGIDITSAEIYTSLTGTWHSFGEVVPMTVGDPVTLIGRNEGVESPPVTFIPQSTSTEAVIGFRTVPITTNDQNGNPVPGVDIWVSTGLYTYYQLNAGDGSVSLPEGTWLLVYGIYRNIYTDFVYGAVGTEVTEADLPFWRATTKATDQDDQTVTGASIELKGVTGAPFAADTSLALPKKAYLRMAGRTGGILGTYKAINWDAQATFDPGFVSPTFTAMANDGSTELADAQIEIVNRGIPPVNSGAAVGLPTGSSIRVIVYRDGTVIANKTGISITAGTTNIEVITSAAP